MRTIARRAVVFLMSLSMFGAVGYAQQPTGRIISITIDQDPVRITYDLYGSPDEDYDVILYIQRENDPQSLRKLTKVSGDVGEGKFSGSRRTIYWDKNEISDVIGGIRYQFALEFRRVGGGGLPWYLYAGVAVVGGVVYWAVKPPPPPPPPDVVTPTIPLPPSR